MSLLPVCNKGHTIHSERCAYVSCSQDLFIRAGGDAAHFDANHIFSPHITLGFTAASATKGLFAPTDLFIENVRPTPLIHLAYRLALPEKCVGYLLPWHLAQDVLLWACNYFQKACSPLKHQDAPGCMASGVLRRREIASAWKSAHVPACGGTCSADLLLMWCCAHAGHLQV